MTKKTKQVDVVTSPFYGRVRAVREKTNALRSILVNPLAGNEGQITDAVRRNLMLRAISETVSRKSASTDSASSLRPSILNPDCPLEPKSLPPCRGKVRMGVNLWNGSVSTPSIALPLQGGGDVPSNGLLGINWIPACAGMTGFSPNGLSGLNSGLSQ